MTSTEAIFIPDGDRYVPTRHACGPWGDGLLHGGPPAGLLARAIERHVPDPRMLLSRLTIDLFRPAPSRPMTVRTRTVREGRRIHVVEASLLDGEVEVTRAAGLLLRESEVDQAGPEQEGALPMPPGPEGIATSNIRDGAPPEGNRGRMLPGFHTMVEVRWVSRPAEPGPNMAWIRIPLPLVAGEYASPLTRVAATADFGNAFANLSRRGNAGHINADITLYLHRRPVGEWIGMQAERIAEPSGLGVAWTVLYDERGPVGRSTHAVIMNPRR